MHQTLPRKSSHTSSHSCKRTNPVRERTTRCPWLLHLCLTRTSRILQLIFRQSRSMSSRRRVDSNHRFATCKASAAGKGDRTRPFVDHDIVVNKAARAPTMSGWSPSSPGVGDGQISGAYRLGARGANLHAKFWSFFKGKSPLEGASLDRSAVRLLPKLHKADVSRSIEKGGGSGRLAIRLPASAHSASQDAAHGVFANIPGV